MKYKHKKTWHTYTQEQIDDIDSYRYGFNEWMQKALDMVGEFVENNQQPMIANEVNEIK